MLFIELIKLKRNNSLTSVNINIFLSDTRYNADYKNHKKYEKRKISQNLPPRLTIHKKITQTTFFHSQRTLRTKKILHTAQKFYTTLFAQKNSTQLTRVAHPCVFAPDATRPAQSALTQRGHVHGRLKLPGRGAEKVT